MIIHVYGGGYLSWIQFEHDVNFWLNDDCYDYLKHAEPHSETLNGRGDEKDEIDEHLRRYHLQIHLQNHQ